VSASESAQVDADALAGTVAAHNMVDNVVRTSDHHALDDAELVPAVDSDATSPPVAADALASSVMVPDVVDNVVGAPDHNSSDAEELVSAVYSDVTPASVTPEEQVVLDSQDTAISVDNALVESGVKPTTDESRVASSDHSQGSGSDPVTKPIEVVVLPETAPPAAPSAVVDELDTTSASEPEPSLHPSVQTSAVFTVAEPSPSAASAGQWESEAVDTFLLPASSESPAPSRRRSVIDDDELVVIDGEHGEASDGDNWSEVEA
jgi:hypothetical protein